MQTTFIAVILLSLLSSITTAAGVALALVLRESQTAIGMGMGFAAGIMILISVVELLPESVALEGLDRALVSASLGAALLWVANIVIPHVHLVAERGLKKDVAVTAYLVVLGLILHDVPEGFAMANAYVASPSLGVLVALAIALHNLPEELVMSMSAMTLRSRRFLFGAALLSALAEPAGAVLGLVAVGISPWLHASFLAFAAGAMLFISVHELIPMARRYKSIGPFIAGVCLSGLVYAAIASMTVGRIGRGLP
ncbi:MAG: ZIP family metal transporter [Thermodesulfobacteriota bacterium]